ncbi:hypothetical protein Mapa_002910 [Marchantia paleacea]|nr:hypothetical protein Mapa_002910 [Marchantia paleacea]
MEGVSNIENIEVLLHCQGGFRGEDRGKFRILLKPAHPVIVKVQQRYHVSGAFRAGHHGNPIDERPRWRVSSCKGGLAKSKLHLIQWKVSPECGSNITAH